MKSSQSLRSRGGRHLRMAPLLIGDPGTAEYLMQASFLKLYRAWPRIDQHARRSFGAATIMQACQRLPARKALP
jgi:hypothetical protein